MKKHLTSGTQLSVHLPVGVISECLCTPVAVPSQGGGHEARMLPSYVSTPWNGADAGWRSLIDDRGRVPDIRDRV